MTGFNKYYIIFSKIISILCKLCFHKWLNAVYMGNHITMVLNLLCVKQFCACHPTWRKSEEPHLAQPYSHATERHLKQHSNDHNAANLTFCVIEVAINIATWSVSIEIQDVRVAKNHQLEFPQFSDEEMHLVQLCLQAFTDISCVLGGVQDTWGNTDDADRAPALEQLTMLRERHMHRPSESSPWLNLYVVHVSLHKDSTT